MSTITKALERLQAKPSDFTWEELRGLMIALGYELKTSGGSGRKFIDGKTRATLFLSRASSSERA